MPDYLPQPDDKLDAFAATFASAVTPTPADWGLTSAQGAAISTALGDWQGAFAAFQAAVIALRAATASKNVARATLESLIRAATQVIQNNPAVTDQRRTSAGLPVYKTTATPSPTPSSTPTLQKIDTGTRGILRLSFADANTPERKAKPAGVMYCEIREQIGGTAPVDPESMAFLAAETRPPHRADFDAPDIGKNVYFALRWVNTRGEPGPWSQIFSAVVPG